jgi:hypothetical protein
VKNIDNITRVLVLRDLLKQLEIDLGLSDLTPGQKNVFFAACINSNAEGAVTSAEMKGHPGLARMPVATFHRCLKDLVDMSFLSRPSGSKAKNFIVNRSAK